MVPSTQQELEKAQAAVRSPPDVLSFGGALKACRQGAGGLLLRDPLCTPLGSPVLASVKPFITAP